VALPPKNKLELPTPEKAPVPLENTSGDDVAPPPGVSKFPGHCPLEIPTGPESALAVRPGNEVSKPAVVVPEIGPAVIEDMIYCVDPGGPSTVMLANEAFAFVNGWATPEVFKMSTSAVLVVASSSVTLESMPRFESNRLYVNGSENGVAVVGMLNTCVIVLARTAADAANSPTVNPAITNWFLIVSMCSTFES
jgi:hypothetical protein